MPTEDRDRAFMQECLALAVRGMGSVSPNPMVGAVLVRNGKVLARGWHKRFGGPHAEIECLREYRGNPRGATMYVSLEPCSHFGKTPPCADALVEAKLGRVVVGMKDPNPLVGGRGIRRLRKAGIDVTAGVMEEEARFLNRWFVTHITEQRPYFHVKIAQTLDGKIAGGPGRWISSDESRQLVHRWRATHDAILLGAGTILSDRPQLNVRFATGRDPHVVILDGRLRLTPATPLFHQKTSRRIILCTAMGSLERHAARARALARLGVDVIGFPAEKWELDLRLVATELHSEGLGSILVEGGTRVFSAFAKAGLIDEMSIFVAPAVYGRGVPAFVIDEEKGHLEALSMGSMVSGRSGSDILVSAYKTKYSEEVLRSVIV